MNKASKIDAILDAWLEYVTLDDYSNARVEASSNKVQLRGITLVSDNLLIDADIFSELQQKVNQDQKGKQETVWVLSFPQVIDVDKGKSYLYPLFSLDVTSILKGDYQAKGWNLDSLTLIEAGENLVTYLRMDDEQREKLITKDGLRLFLETTFRLTFDSYQNWMERVNIPLRYREEVQSQPYLFEFTGSAYHNNLRQDLKEIKSGAKNWSTGHPVFEYLFGKPQPAKEEVIYMGAFPTHAPTNSQSTALKHAQSEPITAVQGPPGSGKTTLILHVIAQQVVKRALNLIETGKDINNLTIVSSANKKAVNNIIEKLDEFFQGNLFYLKGGSKDNIESANGAIAQLQKAIFFLQTHDFNEQLNNSLKQKITQIKDELLAEESRYLELRHQRNLDTERHKHLSDKFKTMQYHLDEIITALTPLQQRARDLADYNQLQPLMQYYSLINKHFDKAELQLSKRKINWLFRLLYWLTGKTEERILRDLNSVCQSAILQTSGTIFRIKIPTSRTDLIQQASLVRERIYRANELKNVQQILADKYNDRDSTNRQKDDIYKELQFLEINLANPLGDFYASFNQKLHDKQKELFKLSYEFLIQQALYNKQKIKQTLELYSSFLLGTWKYKYKLAENLDEHIIYLSLIFPVITCTLLSIRKMIPWIEECVDRTIIDEAGMIDQHKAFPLLTRSRKAIIVGDPLQIEPIINLSKQRRENYRQTAFINKGLTDKDYHRFSPEEEYTATTYHRAAGASGEGEDNGQGIILKEHFRCQPSIIKFCNQIAKYGLEIRTKPENSLLGSHLIAYDVDGNIVNNVNQEEVDAVCEIIERVQKQGYSLEDIGVISAFRAQANALKEAILKKFPQFNKDYVGTIHTFQGSEKKVIILSTKLCRPQDNIYWINKRPNLLNVAVSRAKELFILVGNLYRLEKGNLTRQLVEHIRENGDVVEYKSEADIPKVEPTNTVIYDCDHLEILKKAIDEAEEELIIVTPWIRGSESKLFVNDVVSVLERGVKVTVIYGNKGNGENDDNDANTENNLRYLLYQYSGSQLCRLGEGKHTESRGTNERILICDTKFAVTGSWNWLSHPYRNKCIKSSSLDIKFQIRRDTSIKFSELSSIEDLKARTYQLIRQ